MLSIGLFTYSTKPRGSVVHATYLAEALTQLGHDVALYALSKAGDSLYRELACPVVYLPAGPAPLDASELIAQRIREVEDGAARLVRPHDVYHAEDCLMASGLLSLRGERPFEPLVRTLHHWEHYESAYLRECQRRSVEQADAVACVSRSSQRDVERELGRRCPIIGNGVDVERFARQVPLQEARRQLGLRANDVVVLSVGGVEPRKNSLNALAAMRSVLRRFANVQWLIVGGASIWEHDQYRAQFRQRVAELEPEIAARVRELGPVSERQLTELYQMSRILLCPSLQEGFGLCVLEALASGTAAVVSHGEPFCEYLAPDEACFVDPHSATSIGAALSRLLQDETAFRELVERGRRRAREFSWARVAREHERLYSSVLGRAARNFTPTREELVHA